MLTVLAFLAALTLLIAVHEYGHYRVAVACRVRALRFSIGFGPVLWRWKRTRLWLPAGPGYGVVALPLAGPARQLLYSQGSAPRRASRCFISW